MEKLSFRLFLTSAGQWPLREVKDSLALLLGFTAPAEIISWYAEFLIMPIERTVNLHCAMNGHVI